MLVRDAIIEIRNREDETLLTNSNRFMAMVEDLSPEYTQERNVLRTCIDDRVLQYIFLNDGKPANFKMTSVEYMLRNKGISDTWIEQILADFCVAAQWEGSFEEWKKHHILSAETTRLSDSIDTNDMLVKTVFTESVKKMIEGNYNKVAAGADHVAICKGDGTVVAYGDNKFGQCNVQSWRNITQVVCGAFYTAGLKKDGTVVIAGGGLYNGATLDNAKYWKNIIRLSGGVDHLVGIRNNGKPFACGYNGNGQCDILPWNNIKDVTAGYWFTIGAKNDGSVIYIGKNNKSDPIDVCSWADIVQCDAGNTHVLGVTETGKVLASGRNDFGECNLDTWSNITLVSACMRHSFGIQADGTVVVSGEDFDGIDEVRSWKNVRFLSAFSKPIGHGDFATQVIALADNSEILYVGVNAVKKQINAIDVSSAGNHVLGTEKNNTTIADTEKQKISLAVKELNDEKQRMRAELNALHGLFSGKRKKEIEQRIVEIERHIQRLQS